MDMWIQLIHVHVQMSLAEISVYQVTINRLTANVYRSSVVLSSKNYSQLVPKLTFLVKQNGVLS